MTTTLALRLPGLLEEPSSVHHTSQSRSETDTTCFIPFVWRRILVISIHSMHRSVRSYFLSSLVEGLFHSFGSWSIHFTSCSWRVSTSYPPKRLILAIETISLVLCKFARQASSVFPLIKKRKNYVQSWFRICYFILRLLLGIAQHVIR